MLLPVVLPMALTVALAVALVGCGQAGSEHGATTERAVQECRANPSSLAERWTSVIATVEYYKSTESARDCQANVENQLDAVTALRRFSEKLRPYDMTYQLTQVRAAVDLYLHDPLPDPVPGETGKAVRPPAKAAVSDAMQTLSDNAAQANAELEPAWGQALSVDLDDVDALTTTMHDLDQLAQDSPHWVRCEEALQVLVAAIRAQEAG